MTRKTLTTTTALTLLAGSLIAASTGARAQTPRVTVDRDPVVFSGQPPIEQDGRVLVPLRGVLEKLGAYVQYDAQTQTVIALRGSTRITLPIGGQRADIDGRSVHLDVPAQVVNGSTLVPLRFVAESLGAEVRFDASQDLVAIRTGGGNATSAEFGAPRDRDRGNDRDASAEQRWHPGRDDANAFRGEFKELNRLDNGRFLITTRDGRTIEVRGDTPVFMDDQRLSVRDLRPGDRVRIAVDPDTKHGTRVMVVRD